MWHTYSRVQDVCMPKQRKYTDDELVGVVKSSTSIRQVLQKLGKSLQGGGSYRQIHGDCKRLNIDTSHFSGQGHLRGKTHSWTPKIPLKTILVENSKYACNSTLKRRLLKENLLENRCYVCNQPPVWRNMKLVMVMDHINGIHNDNRLENLRMLCPNCNSQQDTFAGRNKSPR